MWPVPLIVGIFLAPESPWWLVRRGRHQDAVRSVKRLTFRGENADEEAEKTVAMMIHTHPTKLKTTAGATFWDCFKDVDLRRTELVCLTWTLQNACSSF
jgi:SP family general alpha glucoside:H+ symporter-like MFS transporter